MEFIVSLFTSTQFFIAKTLWQPGLLKKEKELALHYQITEKKIQRLKLPSQLHTSIQQGLRFVEQAYNDLFHWFKHYEPEIEIFKYQNPGIINDAQFRCTDFITPLGEFDDLKWVKQFVQNPQHPILDRFSFACFYCLEEEIRTLWQQILHNAWPPIYCNKEYSQIRSYKPRLISFWIHYLEGKQAELLSHTSTNSFFLYGFKSAIREGNEKATYYFWGKLSLQECATLVEDIDNFSGYVYCTAKNGHLKITHFLYSKLTLEQQLCVLQYDMQENGYPSIWCNYLIPAFISFIPEQITLYQDLLPSKAYSSVLFKLTCKLKELRNPIYQETFQTIWQLGSAKNKSEIPKSNPSILRLLLCAKEFTCAELLLKDYSLTQKRDFLVSSEERTIFERFLYHQDWSALEKHLLLFLIELYQEENYSTLMLFHNDSLALLKEFEEKSWFSNWITRITKEEVIPVVTILKNIKLEIETCNFLNDLLIKIEEQILNTSLLKTDTFLPFIENEQKNQAVLPPPMSTSVFFSTSASRKRTHAESDRDSLQKNRPTEIEDKLDASLAKKMKM